MIMYNDLLFTLLLPEFLCTFNLSIGSSTILFYVAGDPKCTVSIGRHGECKCAASYRSLSNWVDDALSSPDNVSVD